MKEYKTAFVKNVAILGHLGSGKTSLAESLLFEAKAIDKKGEVERKNTVGDYTTEEQNRQTTLKVSLLPVEWKDYKINFIDTPGSEEFIGELENALSVVDGAILLLDATKGVEVGSEAAWLELRKRNIPTIILVNKMDKENIKFDEVIESVRTRLSPSAIPFSWPLGKDNQFDGFANVITRKARIFKDGEYHDEEIYPDKLEKIDELYNQVLEKVAESSEELLDKFFSGEELTDDEVRQGLLSGTLAGDVFPIVVGSVVNNVGISTLLDMIVKYLPTAEDAESRMGIDPKTKEVISRKVDPKIPLSAYIFKTIVDPFIGAINFFRVYSGSVKIGQEVLLPEEDTMVKIPQLFLMRGKTQIPVDEVFAGDIGCVAKVSEFMNGHTFCDKKAPIIFDKVEHPSPVLYVAIQPKNKQDEDKISSSLNRLKLEDDTFETKRNPETSQLLVGGQGMTHLGFILDKMRNMFKVDVEITDPKIVYRETIRSMGEAQGRHKKQSGGAGQFGDVWIRFEPTTEHFVFEDKVVGGSVPKNYFPAVEKGLIETLEKGPLAGFPVIGVKATLYDGSYHAVDSNELSFKLAAGIAFKAAVSKIRPTILEPICRVKVIVKDEFVGDIMGDMTKRRGRVLGMEQNNGYQEVTAEVPEAEITKYATDLKAMTQASGRFTREFVRYDEVPEMLVKKIIEDYKVER